MDGLSFIVGFAIAALVALAVHFYLSGRQKGESESLKSQLAALEAQVIDARSENNARGATLLEAEKKVAQLSEQIEQERLRSQEKLDLLNDAKKILSDQFKILANDIFEEKGKKFTEKNKESLEVLINPLKENITDFKKKIETTRQDQIRESTTLKAQLDGITQANVKLSEDAQNLTNALKGQSQAQGAWGEMILEVLLEHTGLQKGIHFETQFSTENEEGRRLRPDAVIHLADGRDMVIDCKVSLNAFDRYIAAENEDDKSEHLKVHIRSLNNHIKELSDKDYFDLVGINSQDYVLMFVPNEGAISAAVEYDNKFIINALLKKVYIVTPTTLPLAMRIIDNMWQQKRQSENAEEIAQKAGAMYDKFVLFLDEFLKIEGALGNASKAYTEALKRLNVGRGNLIGQAKNIKSMGAKTKKSLPKSLIEEDEMAAIEPTEFLVIEGDVDR